MARQEPTLEKARINPNQVIYHVLAVNAVLVAFIVTIPLLIVSIPISYWIYHRRYKRLLVTLHPKTLKIRQGILVVNEKTIPLNKITDLAISHGPIMRMFSLKGLRVETAGQTGAGGALAMVVGIVDTEAFRDAVLDQRDHVAERESTSVPSNEGSGEAPVRGGPDPARDTLLEIRDSLLRIEERLGPPSDGK